MATVDLGRIKFVWQGTYNAATAYVVDDVVYSDGSAYVCILASTGNAPTNTTYWNKMAQGSDLGSISGIAQGDIFYYNGTDFARLAAGTAGQALVTGGSGANPSWGSSFDELTDVGIMIDTAGSEGPSGPSSTHVSERYGAMTIFNASNLNMRQTSFGNQVITIQEAGDYFIKCAGASGGGLGGLGGLAWGVVTLSASDNLFVRVGQAGNQGQSTSSTSTPTDPDSTNFSNANNSSTSYGGFGDGFGGQSSMYSGSGGGATAIRLNTDAIANRIIVAGGGGGCYQESTATGTQSNTAKGGDGGGWVGTRSEGSGNALDDYGRGGTQSAGGSSSAGSTGTQAQGGNAFTGNDSGGGGGGYWGGGGGGDNCPGGGGSGYVGGMNTANRGMAIGGNHGHGWVYIRKVG